MKIYDDLLEHIRRRIQLHEIAGDYEMSTESLKIYLDEWEQLSKLHQPTVISTVCCCSINDNDRKNFERNLNECRICEKQIKQTDL